MSDVVSASGLSDLLIKAKTVKPLTPKSPLKPNSYADSSFPPIIDVGSN